MRLIDADALKRKAQKVATEAWKIKLKSPVETVLNQFIDWINAQPTIEPEQRWTPCSKRMPEEREWIGTKMLGTTISNEVFVTFETSDGQRFADHISFQNGKLSRSDEQRMRVFYNGAKPIAWMPFPEPYREGEQE